MLMQESGIEPLIFGLGEWRDTTVLQRNLQKSLSKVWKVCYWYALAPALRIEPASLTISTFDFYCISQMFIIQDQAMY